MRRPFLTCGILASFVYLAANVVAPLRYPDYDWVTQTVSELSAIGSPTRGLWVAMMVAYTLLMMGFAAGIWMSSGDRRALRLAAVFTFTHVLFALFWPPMNRRGVEFATTDLLHIVWTAVAVPLMMLQILSAAIALGRRFRVYSAATVAVMIIFTVLTSIEAPSIAVDGPTPHIGVWERIGIAAYMVWVPALAIALLGERRAPKQMLSADLEHRQRDRRNGVK